MSEFDLSVTFPSPGLILLRSCSLFADPEGPTCRRFLERVFQADEITEAAIRPGTRPRAELRYGPRTSSAQVVVSRIAALLRQTPGAPPPKLPSTAAARDRRGAVRYYRYGRIVTGWKVLHDEPGRLRVENQALFRRAKTCRVVERELLRLASVAACKASTVTSTVQIRYDPRRLTGVEIIEALDLALVAETPLATVPRKRGLQLSICTASLPLAAAAEFVFPPLLPVAAVLFAYTAIPTFEGARKSLVQDRRIGADVLDATVLLGCLGTMSIVPGAVLCWCLTFGRALVQKTHQRSQKVLLDDFGKLPENARLYRDGFEVRVACERIGGGDIVVVEAGDVVPVDGHVVEGLALVDQHSLTGDPAAVERGVGDRVFASTIVLAGKVYNSAGACNGVTAAAQVRRILNEAANFHWDTRLATEQVADKSVVPTLAVGALGFAAVGSAAGLAVLKSNPGAGMRTAAPYAVLGSLARCAYEGIVVRDARALEIMNEVDTVLLDASAIRSAEQLDVVRIVAVAGLSQDGVVSLAAAAVRKFHLPLALALGRKAVEVGLRFPPADEVEYRIGHGISALVGGRAVRVGTERFLETAGIGVPSDVRLAIDASRQRGRVVALVAIDGEFGGAIELVAAVRPAAPDVVASLRARGMERIALVSGDDEAATAQLAEWLGVDQHFARVLPAEKADYVQRLRNGGHRVCFVGDGVSDSIAARQADVSISLRGAHSVATDAAAILFLRGDLGGLLALEGIARDLDRSVKRTWSVTLAPNVACVIGVFTMGFGLMAAVVASQVAALAGLASGVLPLRHVARIEAQRRHRLELSQSAAKEEDVS
ncbi:MAG: HAD-IC family P-type ATPase [Isosphaeraceae bacterium]|nr:HAD-IC family P-type ATPase [Isosphaeraceae bacterium]